MKSIYTGSVWIRVLSLALVFAHTLSYSIPSALSAELIVQNGSVNDWETFNVAAGETTSISVVDENGLAMVDGRAIINVLQDYATRIDGNLDISGIIAFFNANGFDIGADANVNVVGGLILSTLGISQTDFFNGMAQLNQAMGGPGFIQNAGHVNVDPGSFFALIAGAIKNTGTIAADGGTAILAAGSKGTLSIGGDGLVEVQITEKVDAEVYDFQGNKVADQIDNSGTIAADGGLVKLTAKGAEEVFDNVINHSGMIRARSVSVKNGEVELHGGDEGIVTVTGTIDVSGEDGGETGGTVHVLGHHVGLFENALIDASGSEGGGVILIGGDYRGQNPFIHNAEAVYVGPDTTLNASALNHGDGGKLIVWGNESARAYGTISAGGGLLSGDGGFVETSAHYLDVDGIRVSTAAPQGHAGLWLLDPYNLTISSSPGNHTSFSSPFEPTGSESILNVTTLQNALGVGDVTVQTGGDFGPGNGDITLASTITSISPNVLTLNAHGNILLNANINSGGDLVLTAGGDIIQGSSAGINMAGPITAKANNIYLNGSGNNFTSSLFLGNESGNPIDVSIRNAGYTTQSLADVIFTTGGAVQYSGFALDLPNYNPNAGSDTSLSAFLTYNVLASVPDSPNFNLSLILPSYVSEIEIGDNNVDARPNYVDLTYLVSLSYVDTLHNLTVKTAGTINLKMNNSGGAIFSANNVDFETTNGDVLVLTGQSNNGIQTNGSLTLESTGGDIHVDGFDQSSQIQTPELNTTTAGGAITLANLTGVDGNSFALNMTENNNAMPDLTLNSGVAEFNSFSLNASNFNGTANALASFLNNKILNNVARPAYFDLALSLANFTNTLNIGTSGGGGYINLRLLEGAIRDLSVRSAGNINLTQQGGDDAPLEFSAHGIDLESTAGNVSVNAVSSSDRLAISTALTLKAANSGSTINVNNTGVGRVDTPVLAIEGNESTINLTKVTPDSSFTFNLIENSASALSGLNTSNIGEFDSFSLTANNFDPGSSDTSLTTFLNNFVLNYVALPSLFDLELNLPSYTAGLALGTSFGSHVSFASIENRLHDLTVSTAGSLGLYSLGSDMQAHAVTLSTTGASSSVEVSYLEAPTVSLSATGADGSILATRVTTNTLNTTTNGGTVNLDGLEDGFALNMTENSNAMPDLVFGQNDDEYVPVFSSFSLTAPNFNPDDGDLSLENFLNNSILPHADIPGLFDLSLDLASDTNTIAVLNLDFDVLGGTLHDLSISSAGHIHFLNASLGAITTHDLTFNTTGSGKDVEVSAVNLGNSLTFSKLNIATNGGSVTLRNEGGGVQTYDLNLTENSNALPELSIAGTVPRLTSFSLTAPNLNLATGLEDFVNTVLDYAFSPSTFDLGLDLASYANELNIGDDSGNYIDLNADPLNNTIGNLTIKTAGTINFISGNGHTITANDIDLETTEFSGAINIKATTGSDVINANQITAKATGRAGSISTRPDAAEGSINTTVLNTETNGGTIAINGITSDFALNITENSNSTPDLVLDFGSSDISRLNVTLPNYNLGSNLDNNASLPHWFTYIFQNNFPASSSGFNLAINTPANPHSLTMGYGADGYFIDLSQIQDSSHTPVTSFGELRIRSAGEVNLVAGDSSLTADSADLETTGLLSDVNIVSNPGKTITLTSSSVGLKAVATGGGDITTSGNAASISARTVNITTAGGSVDLSKVKGSGSPDYTLSLTDNSGLVPTLIAAAGSLASFSFTAPNLIWNINSAVESLLDRVFSNETGSTSEFDFNWTTAAFRDALDLAALGAPDQNNQSLSSFGSIVLGAAAIGGNLNVTTTHGSITQNSLGQVLGVYGTTNLTAKGDIILTDENNFFNNHTVTVTGDNIDLRDAAGAGTVLGAVTATGSFNALVGGPLTLTDTLSADGSVTIVAPSIILSADLDAGEHTVSLTATDTDITTGNNAIEFGDGTLTAGDLNLTSASGSIADDFGVVHSSGTLTIGASDGANDDGNNVYFSGPTHNFGTVNITNAANVTLNAASGYIISGITSTGDISANTNDGLDDPDTTGTLEVSGAIVTTKTGGSISLSNPRTSAEYGIQITADGSLQAPGDITLSTNESAGGLTNNGINILGSISNTSGAIYIYYNRNYDPPDSRYAAIMNIEGSITTETGTITLQDFGSGTITLADGSVLDGGSTGVLTLQSDAGELVQSGGSITAVSTALSSTTGIDFTAGENSFGSLTASAGDGPITITDSNTDGLTLVSIQAPGDITVQSAGTLSFGGDDANIIISDGASEKTVTLAAVQFNNQNTGDDEPIDLGSGTDNAWHFYLTNLDGNTFGNLDSGNQAIWATEYPTAISAEGNRYIFATEPTLTLTPMDLPFSVSTSQGAAALLPDPEVGVNFQVTGFVDASNYGNVFTQDTVDNVELSGFSFDSLGVLGTIAGPYDVTLTGDAMATSGYSVTYDDMAVFGSLTVIAPAAEDETMDAAATNEINKAIARFSDIWNILKPTAPNSFLTDLAALFQQQEDKLADSIDLSQLDLVTSDQAEETFERLTASSKSNSLAANAAEAAQHNAIAARLSSHQGSTTLT